MTQLRLSYLDGIRGILACIVINEHFLKVFYPSAFFDSSAIHQFTTYTELLAFPPFTLFHNGAWAVSAFFVLSGFVLANGLSGKDLSKLGVYAYLLKRYLRFALPVFFSLLLLYLIYVFNVEHISEILAETGSRLDSPFESESPSLGSIAYQGLFLSLFTIDFRFNPVLWTISFEVYGSFIVLMYVGIYQLFQHRDNDLINLCIKIGLLILMLHAFANTMFVLFVLGVLAYELNNGIKEVLSHKSIKIAMALMAFFLLNIWVRGGVHHPMNFVQLHVDDAYKEYLYNGLGAFFMILVILNSQKAQKLLSGNIVVFLGNVSFSLYLTHFSVLYSVTSWIFTIAEMSYEEKVGVSVLFSIPIMVLVAYLFNRFIDQPTLSILKRYFG